MDPTHRRHPKPTPFIASASAAAAAAAAAKLHHHPKPDPTIQTISHRFSKLYANHEKITSNSVNPPHPHSNPQPDPHFHEKILAFPPVFDTSCTALTKSKSHHERKNFAASKVEGTRSKVKGKEELKKQTNINSKKSSNIEYDVKKASQLMSRSLESDRIMGIQKGFEGRKSSIASMALVSGGRRKSFCSSYLELADILSCSGVKVLAVDMPPFMQINAVNCARKTHDSLEKFTSKTLAFTLKKEFDAAYGPAWHCIVGTSFGSFVTHSVGGFMYFSMDHKIYILLFKTTVQKADSN